MAAIVNAYTVQSSKAPKADTPKECKVSFAEFCRNAAPTVASVSGSDIALKPREYSTGSFGWMGMGKAEVKLANGQTVRCQVDIKLIVVNSKNADRSEAPAETVG